MELYDFLKHLNSGAPVYSDSEAFEYMHELSNEAMRITFRLNGSYHTPEEIRALFSQLTGKPVDESFRMFPPFYTDCGKNTTIGKMFSSIPAVIFRIKAASLSGTVR